MQFSLLFLSSLALLASSAAIGPLHHHDWSQSDRQFYSAVNSIRTASPSLSCTMPSPSDMPSSALPPPSPGLSVFHVAVGRGTQNYSCPSGIDPSTSPTALGALANLYNVTCLSSFSTATNPPTTPLSLIPPILLLSPPPQPQNPTPIHPLPRSSLLTGHHYFANTTLPTFNLNQRNTGSEFGVYFTEKRFNTSAPVGGAVAWLKLGVVGEQGGVGMEGEGQGGGVKEVYRVNTAGGNAPADCEGRVGTSFEVGYAAEYWFFGE